MFDLPDPLGPTIAVTPVHLTRAYADLGLGRGSFPVAEQAADEILSLPLYPHITEAQQQQVVAALRSALAARRSASQVEEA